MLFLSPFFPFIVACFGMAAPRYTMVVKGPSGTLGCPGHDARLGNIALARGFAWRWRAERWAGRVAYGVNLVVGDGSIP